MEVEMSLFTIIQIVILSILFLVVFGMLFFRLGKDKEREERWAHYLALRKQQRDDEERHRYWIAGECMKTARRLEHACCHRSPGKNRSKQRGRK